MKIIILLLITIGTVLGGKCPPSQVITPCTCDHSPWQWDEIKCYTSVNHIGNIFDLASKNLKSEQEKHFDLVTLLVPNNKSQEESTLNDNSFAEITMKQFDGSQLKKVSNKAFGKLQSEKLVDFMCDFCSIQNPEPNYNIWSVLSQFPKLYRVFLGSNITEVPSNAIKQQINDTSNSKFEFISFISNPKNNSITIKSGAFQNLNKLNGIELRYYSSPKFEKGAFKFSPNNKEKLLSIEFDETYLKGN